MRIVFFVCAYVGLHRYVGTLQMYQNKLGNCRFPVAPSEMEKWLLNFEKMDFKQVKFGHYCLHWAYLFKMKLVMDRIWVIHPFCEINSGQCQQIYQNFANLQQHNADLLTFTNNQLSVLPLAPEMPQASVGHCAVALNSTTVLTIGGKSEMMRSGADCKKKFPP